MLTPRPGVPGQVMPVQPQARADDGYIYPSDGSSTERSAIRRRGRRVYGAQVYPREQYYYASRLCAAIAPQGYYQPRQYYQPRGLFTYQD